MKGFTLIIELMIVVAIVAILTATAINISFIHYRSLKTNKVPVPAVIEETVNPKQHFQGDY